MTDSDTEKERNKKRIRGREKMKILEERKTEKQKIIRNMYIKEIQK